MRIPFTRTAILSCVTLASVALVLVSGESAAIGAPVTYVTEQAYGSFMRMGLLAPGVLRLGDIPQLAALSAPRRLVITEGRTPQGKLVRFKELQQLFHYVPGLIPRCVPQDSNARPLWPFIESVLDAHNLLIFGCARKRFALLALRKQLAILSTVSKKSVVEVGRARCTGCFAADKLQGQTCLALCHSSSACRAGN